MGWDFNHRLNSLSLAEVANHVRIESEGGSSFADPGMRIPGRDGVRFDDQAPYGPLFLSLRTTLRWTDQNGAITHTDGEGGHIYENASKIKKELGGRGLGIYRRTLPHIGTVRALYKLTQDPTPLEQRQIYNWFLTVPSGSWQDDDESSDEGDPATGVTTGGDREIFDPRVSLPSPGTRTVTTAEGLVYSIVAAAGPTYPVVIDVGAGTILDNGGADAGGAVTFSHQHWFRLSADHTHIITGSGTWFWRSRWA